MSEYQPSKIEPKWQAFWDEQATFKTEVDHSKEKYYVLDMFPYPSGNGLHVGHVENYTGSDIFARYKMAKGFNVLHPMGWDSFGLPTEQYALKTGIHPAEITETNIGIFKKQLKNLGLGYDWDREIRTSDPDYYKWTQWIFLQLYNRDLAYIAETPVNWCPELGTVLSNEEVQDGKSEVGGFPVIRKPMRQWMLKITEYADRLIDDLDLLDWPESLKEMQRNWIGKSLGAEVDFKIDPEFIDNDAKIRVYTTRPDTLFGATYMVLSPEHALVNIITTSDQKSAVEAYQLEATKKSERARNDESKEKTGVFTGAYAINPVNDERVPIWIADYVLASYGTGAIMAVPAHDVRDYAFAKKFELPIIEVVSGGSIEEEAYVGQGKLINSGILDGLSIGKAKKKIAYWLEQNNCGQSAVNYKLRDWLFSRQRYWGEPFPLVMKEDGTYEALPEEMLPLRLPEIEDYKPNAAGEPPLSRAVDWVNEPENGTRETNTMPQWAGSCWYYLRFLDPDNTTMVIDPEKEKYWMPVDMYVGGTEHAVLHLLYARFWHKVLYDCGIVTTKEPFQKIVNQGMILGIAYEYYEGSEDKKVYSWKELTPEIPTLKRTVHVDDVRWVVDGDLRKAFHPDHDVDLLPLTEKMSKSRGNVVNPDDVIADFGADTLRMYVMFMGPFEQSKPWKTESVPGVFRFVNRIWRLFCDEEGISEKVADIEMSDDTRRSLHSTIKRVTDDTEKLRFNKAIALMMEFMNHLYKLDQVPKEAAVTFTQLLAPYAPHLSEELWQRFGNTTSVIDAGWPEHNEAFLVVDTIELGVQVMGKVRGTISIAPDASEEVAVAAAKKIEGVMAQLEGKEIRRIIYKEGRILNFVT